MASEYLRILTLEHENILKLADLLEEKVIKIGEKLDEAWFEKAIKFIRNYADKFHHAKEEDILFAEFLKCVEKGEAHCNPIDQMFFEHKIGRDNVKKMEEGLRDKNIEKLSDGAISYIALIREHISKEDNVLYPMADGMFNNQIKNKIFKKFKEVESKNKKVVKESMSLIAL